MIPHTVGENSIIRENLDISGACPKSLLTQEIRSGNTIDTTNVSLDVFSRKEGQKIDQKSNEHTDSEKS